MILNCLKRHAAKKFIAILFLYSFGCKRQASHFSQQSSKLTIEDFDSLEKFLATEQPKELNALLPFFSRNIKNSSLLFHTSRGSQPSNFLQPRVIAFNKDASFILAFATAETGAGHDAMKLISFDQQKSKFVFSEVVQEESGLILNKNPKGCESCHGARLRPNWDPYDLWPGMYGSGYLTSILANDDPASHSAKTYERQKLEEFNQAPPKKWRSFSGIAYDQGSGIKNNFDKFSRALSILNHRKIFAEIKSSVSHDRLADWVRDASVSPEIVLEISKETQQRYALTDLMVAKAREISPATREKIQNAIHLWKEQVIQRLNAMYPDLVVNDSFSGRAREYARKNGNVVPLQKVKAGDKTQFDFSSFSDRYGGFFDEPEHERSKMIIQKIPNYFERIVAVITAAEVLGLKTEDWSLTALNVGNNKGKIVTGGYTFSNGAGSISRLKEDSERPPGYVDPY